MSRVSIYTLNNREFYLVYGGQPQTNCACNDDLTKKECEKKCEMLNNFREQYENTGVLPPHQPVIVTRYTYYPKNNATDITIELFE